LIEKLKFYMKSNISTKKALKGRHIIARYEVPGRGIHHKLFSAVGMTYDRLTMRYI
jgi:hypothetical protein